MGDLVYVGQYVEKQSLAVCLYRVEVITVTYFYYWGSCLVSGWLAGQTDRYTVWIAAGGCVELLAYR